MEGFGAAAMRTYNSFLLPRSVSTLAAAESGGKLARLSIDPSNMEARPEGFGALAMRSYNSFLLPSLAVSFAAAVLVAT